MALQPAYCDRGRKPVITGTGLDLDLEDVMGEKVCALASGSTLRGAALWPARN